MNTINTRKMNMINARTNKNISRNQDLRTDLNIRTNIGERISYLLHKYDGPSDDPRYDKQTFLDDYAVLA